MSALVVVESLNHTPFHANGSGTVPKRQDNDMASSESERRTLDYYDSHAGEWVATHGGTSGPSFWKDEMRNFEALLPSGSVLEIGPGGGKDAAELIAFGYRYTGADASAGLLRVAQERNPRATFVLVNVYDLDFSRKFDGFWAAASLLHIPKSRIPEALQRIRINVRKGGIGFISLKQGDGEGPDEKTGRWFSYYQAGEFEQKLEAAGFRTVKLGELAASKDTWLTFLIRRL